MNYTINQASTSSNNDERNFHLQSSDAQLNSDPTSQKQSFKKKSIASMDIRRPIEHIEADEFHKILSFLRSFVLKHFGYLSPPSCLNPEMGDEYSSQPFPLTTSFSTPVIISGLAGLGRRGVPQLDRGFPSPPFILDKMEFLVHLEAGDDLKAIQRGLDPLLVVETSSYNKSTNERTWRMNCKHFGSQKRTSRNSRKSLECTGCPSGAIVVLRRLDEEECENRGIENPEERGNHPLSEAQENISQEEEEEKEPKGVIIDVNNLPCHASGLPLHYPSQINEEEEAETHQHNHSNNEEKEDEEEEEEEREDTHVFQANNPSNSGKEDIKFDKEGKVQGKGVSVHETGWYELVFRNVVFDHNHVVVSRKEVLWTNLIKVLGEFMMQSIQLDDETENLNLLPLSNIEPASTFSFEEHEEEDEETDIYRRLRKRQRVNYKEEGVFAREEEEEEKMLTKYQLRVISEKKRAERLRIKKMDGGELFAQEFLKLIDIKPPSDIEGVFLPFNSKAIHEKGKGVSTHLSGDHQMPIMVPNPPRLVPHERNSAMEALITDQLPSNKGTYIDMETEEKDSLSQSPEITTPVSSLEGTFNLLIPPPPPPPESDQVPKLKEENSENGSKINAKRVRRHSLVSNNDGIGDEQDDEGFLSSSSFLIGDDGELYDYTYDSKIGGKFYRPRDEEEEDDEEDEYPSPKLFPLIQTSMKYPGPSASSSSSRSTDTPHSTPNETRKDMGRSEERTLTQNSQIQREHSIPLITSNDKIPSNFPILNYPTLNDDKFVGLLASLKRIGEHMSKKKPTALTIKDPRTSIENLIQKQKEGVNIYAKTYRTTSNGRRDRSKQKSTKEKDNT